MSCILSLVLRTEKAMTQITVRVVKSFPGKTVENFQFQKYNWCKFLIAVEKKVQFWDDFKTKSALLSVKRHIWQPNFDTLKWPSQ